MVRPDQKSLRRSQTPAEKAAWHLLRDRRLAGVKFRRQHAIGRYVVDFYCLQLRLAIELEGSVHSQPSQVRKDAIREDYLRRLGVKVVYIPNGMALEDPEAFISAIRNALPSPGLRPPSPNGRGLEV